MSEEKEEFPARALPLLTIEKDASAANGWRVIAHEEAVAVLSRIEMRLCVVAVAGGYRTGKSSLMNWLVQQRDGAVETGACGDGAFGVGHKVERCTRGIWMWGRPVILSEWGGDFVMVPHASNEKVEGGEQKKNEKRRALLFLDTEGLGGLGDVDSAYEATIFALSALLASTLLYNSLGVLDERAIMGLGFVANLSQRMRVADEDEDDTATSLADRMPKLVWVLRDFALELVSEDGETMSSNEYLESALKPNGKDASADSARRALSAYFPHRGCVTLPRPFVGLETATENIMPIQNQSMPAMRAEFRDAFRTLCSELLAGIGESRGIPGKTLAKLVIQYAALFSSDAVPTLSSAWRRVVEDELAEAQHRGIATHAASLAAVTHQSYTPNNQELKSTQEATASEDIPIKSWCLTHQLIALGTAHTDGCRSAEDGCRGIPVLVEAGSRYLARALDRCIKEVRLRCDAHYAKTTDEILRRAAQKAGEVAAEITSSEIAPAVEATRGVFALASDPPSSNALLDIDDAEKRVRNWASTARAAAFGGAPNSTPRASNRHINVHADRAALRCVDFAVSTAFATCRALADSADQRRAAALSEAEQARADAEQKLAFLSGRDKALEASVDEQLKESHDKARAALELRARSDALEAALKAERSRSQKYQLEAEQAKADLEDVSRALDNEQKWQLELQERLDLRIQLAKEREEDLAQRLQRVHKNSSNRVLSLRRLAAGTSSYTVLDFLLDDAKTAAMKLDIDAEHLERFCAEIDLVTILPSLKKIGAARVSDLIYLEPEDLDELELDKVQKRRLLQAVEQARKEYGGGIDNSIERAPFGPPGGRNGGGQCRIS